MRSIHHFATTIAAISAATGVIFAGAADATYRDPSGAVRIVGYNDMSGMIERFDALYAAAHPGTRFHPELRGTATALPALTHGITLVAPIGAEFSPLELVPYKKIVGASPLLIKVAHAVPDHRAKSGPLAIIVSRSNPLSEISLSQLQRLFGTGASGGDFTLWGQLSSGPAFARLPVHPVGLAEETALGFYFRHRVLHEGRFTADFDGLDESAAVVKRVAEDSGAIGFASATAVDDSVKVLAAAGRDGASASLPTVDAIRAGTYPLDRFLYLALRAAPDGSLDSTAVEYVRIALSPAGQDAVAHSTPGYLPLRETEVSAELAKLDGP